MSKYQPLTKEGAKRHDYSTLCLSGIFICVASITIMNLILLVGIHNKTYELTRTTQTVERMGESMFFLNQTIQSAELQQILFYSRNLMQTLYDFIEYDGMESRDVQERKRNALDMLLQFKSVLNPIKIESLMNYALTGLNHANNIMEEFGRDKIVDHMHNITESIDNIVSHLQKLKEIKVSL